jgi:hypothetical protein
LNRKLATISGLLVSNDEFERRRAAEAARIEAVKRSKQIAPKPVLTLADQVFGEKSS